ncbi:MAG: hypothetical protein LUF80_02520, partial [Oscillospiraceae bacterium]|nr:hypothetical protein [Oscillospiraceae bacterium]
MKNAAFGKKALALALAFCLIGQAGALGVFGGAYAAQKTDAAETASEDAAIVETEEETDSGAPEEDTITDSEEDEEFEGETVTVVPDWDCADNDELLEGYLESILYNEVTVT